MWHPAVVIASWFWTGFLPVMPGSWGSLAALPCAWAIGSAWGASGLAIAAGFVFVAGWWSATVVAKEAVARDPDAVVVDEVAAQFLAVLPAPFDPFWYAASFLLFRVFDIWKPWPVGWADRRVHGGFGVMLDDLLAAVYAVIALSILLAIGGALGVRS